jgi:hypothetical protein
MLGFKKKKKYATHTGNKPQTSKLQKHTFIMYLGAGTGVNPLMVNTGDPIYLVISRCKHHFDESQSMLGDLISSLKLWKVNLEHWVEELSQQQTSLTK